MKKYHGTPFGLGQYNEVLTAVVKSLPKALAGRDPKILIAALQKKGALISKEVQDLFAKIEWDERWKVWKTVQAIEDYYFVNADNVINVFNANDIKTDVTTILMLAKIDYGSIPSLAFDLVCVSGSELGFDRSVSRQDLYVRALEMKLSMCSAFIAHIIRLEYLDQPENETLRIAMTPVDGVANMPRIFRISNIRGQLMLSNDNGEESCSANPNLKWIFIKGKW